MSQLRGRSFRILATLLASLTFLLLAEAAFRLFLPVSDIPYWEADALLGYRHRANLTGSFVSAEYDARFRLNNRGWNSPADYTPVKPGDLLRIAVIGDSYVEALQVDVEQGLGPLLEKRLRQSGKNVEVFTYAISGASTAYLHDLLTAEVLKDRPDCIIYVFINNDVRDSVPFLGTAQRWGPLYETGHSGNLVRLPLRIYQPRFLSRLFSHSALFRYFWVNRGMGTLWQTAKPVDLLQGRSLTGEEGLTVAGSPEAPQWERAWEVVGALIGEMSKSSRAAGADFFVVNRPDSGNSYPPARPGDINLPEKHLSQLAGRYDFEFVDLRPWFARDWEAKHQRFEFARDYHWNRHGQEVAAQALEQALALRNVRWRSEIQAADPGLARGN